MKALFVFLFITITSLVQAQADTVQPPYKRFPTLPPLQLLLGDSATKYTKANLPRNKPVLLMIFSPDCSHCQHTAEEVYKNKKELQHLQIVMSSMAGIEQINGFMEKYKLKELDNIVAGKDIYFLLPPFYGIHNLPFMAFYNRKGKLISAYEGSLDIVHVLKIFKEHK